MPAWFYHVYNFLLSNNWIIYSIVIIALGAVLHWIERAFYRYFKRRLLKRRAILPKSLLQALHRPIVVLIWVVTLTLVLEIIVRQMNEGFLIWIVDIAYDVLITLVLIWIGLRLLSQIEQRLLNIPLKKRKIDKTTLRAFGQIGRGIIIGGGVLIGLEAINAPVSGVIAFGGFGGIAIGFAAKDLLSNFFGSMMVFLDRPFVVGEWIRIPEKNIEGTVETIDWRLTRIRTFDKRELYVPNSVFSLVTLENPSRMTHRRINTRIGIRYCDADKMASIVNDVKTMVRSHADIDSQQLVLVNFAEFGQSSLNFLVYAFTRTTIWAEYYEICQSIYLKIIEIIENHGAKLALPASSMYFDEPVPVKQFSEHNGTHDRP